MLIRQSKTLAKAMQVLSNDGLYVSFSRFGEDRVLFSILHNKKRLNRPGFFVDVGAHHPWRKSNTALLSHFKRWRGINIDANEEAIEEFKNHRPKDINICAAVSDEVGEVEYAMFNRPGVNTLDKDMAEKQLNAPHGAYQLERTVKMTSQRLEAILAEHLPTDQEIDFMSIDVEGFDLKVLQSNDWEKYRPFLLAVESHGMDLMHAEENSIYAFMIEQGYKLVSQCFVTSFYIRSD